VIDVLPETVRRAAVAGYAIQMTCRHCGAVQCADVLSMLAADMGDVSIFSLAASHCANCGKRDHTIALIEGWAP
jgi:Fe-S-cluster-containing hydrogenase component 2